MTRTPTSPSSPHRATRRGAALTGLGAALAAAFVLVPPAVATTTFGGELHGRQQLARAARTAFLEYWTSGQRAYSPALDQVVESWSRYHVVKAVMAALLLVVLVRLAQVIGHAPPGSRLVRRIVHTSAGAVVAGLAGFSALLLMANVQGAVAPFASLLPVVADGATGPVAVALDEAGATLTEGTGSEAWTAPLDAMLADFTRYHLAMAGLAGAATAALVATAVLVRRRRTGASAGVPHARRVLVPAWLLATSGALATALLAAANLSTAAHPAVALATALDGGW